MTPPLEEQEISCEFKLNETLIYLNHAAVSPWPLRTQQAVCTFAEENAINGAYHYPKWLEKEAHLRHQLAELINADASDIALLKNTSEALSVVAYGIDWQQGDNVVISDQEFPSNRIVWESLAPLGVEVRQIDLDSAETPEQALIAATDSRTRLLSISSVQYASGLRVDLPVLGEHCHAAGIWFCVDAIQSIGALQTDAHAMRADFVMADGHKWMLGPEGLALFYSSKRAREQLQVRQYGWHMVEQHDDFTRKDWQIAKSARRFECGSPNMLCIHALSASLSLLLEVGMPHVEQRLLDNSRCLIEVLNSSKQLQILSNTDEGRYAGIILFRHRKKDSRTLYTKLMEAGVVCALRDGALRYSPHFYTDQAKILQAVEMAEQV